MRNVKAISSILLLFVLSVTTNVTAQRMFMQLGAQIQITDVKNVGVSAANAAKSIIEVRWQANIAPNINVKSFDVKLEVTYADGAVVTAQSSAGAQARSGRVEVPTTHLSPNGTSAPIKSIKASVTTTFTETATKQFPT